MTDTGAENMRMIGITTKANGWVEARRKEIGGDDPIKACKQAIQEIVPMITEEKGLTDDEIDQLNAHLKKTFSDALQERRDRVDAQMKRPE